MARDLGGQIDQTQTRRRNGSVRQFRHCQRLVTLEQLQPTGQALGDHAELGVIGIHPPLPRRMSSQSNVVIGLFDQILDRRALGTVRHHLGRTPFLAPNTGHKHAVAASQAKLS